MTDREAISQLRRLMKWLEALKPCFGHRAQVLALRRYVQGLLSDSSRKSMEAMLSRVTEPGSYQAFQHFITNAPWSADRVWRRLRETLPERRGMLIFDATTFLKQGDRSVGVTRQYSGRQGQIVNCQAAVTAALWTGLRAYLVGAALYLPKVWLTDEARIRAHIPPSVSFKEKWRQVLTLLRQVRASGVQIDAVLADAEFGDNRMFRGMLHRLGLPYAVGVSSHLTAFLGRPTLQPPGAPRGPYGLAPGLKARHVDQLIVDAGPRWRRVRWRNLAGSKPCEAVCAVVRVTPGVDHRHPKLPPEIWLLAEQDGGEPSKTKYFYVNLPPTASLSQIVRLAHQRWAIEQQYQELKTELGLHHFEGRTFPGWQHHVVLTAVAYNFIQSERRRAGNDLTFPVVRGIIQEIFTAYLFAQKPHYLSRIQALRSVQLRM